MKTKIGDMNPEMIPVWLTKNWSMVSTQINIADMNHTDGKLDHHILTP